MIDRSISANYGGKLQLGGESLRLSLQAETRKWREEYQRV